MKVLERAVSKPVAEIEEGSGVISSAEEMLDLMAEAGMSGCDSVLIPSSCLQEDFFDLRTKTAGEILQKFSNYRMKLAITGDFSDVSSKSLRDFIRESNRGRTVRFAASREEALEFLGK